MSKQAHKPTPRRRGRVIAWMPAALVITTTIVTALGLSPVGSVNAATGTQTITVSADVALDVHVNYNSCGTSGTLANVTGVSPTAITTSLNSCSITFGTNSAVGGAVLSIKNVNASGVFFCRRSTPTDPTTACVAGALNQLTDASTPNAGLGEGEAGASGTGNSGCTTANWTPGATNYNPITNAGTNVCTQTTVGTDGGYQFNFAFNPNGNINGSYMGRAVATATAS